MDATRNAFGICQDRGRATDAYRAAFSEITAHAGACMASCATVDALRALGGRASILAAAIADVIGREPYRSALATSCGSKMIPMTIADVLRSDVPQLRTLAEHRERMIREGKI